MQNLKIDYLYALIQSKTLSRIGIIWAVDDDWFGLKCPYLEHISWANGLPKLAISWDKFNNLNIQTQGRMLWSNFLLLNYLLLSGHFERLIFMMRESGAWRLVAQRWSPIPFPFTVSPNVNTCRTRSSGKDTFEILNCRLRPWAKVPSFLFSKMPNRCSLVF